MSHSPTILPSASDSVSSDDVLGSSAVNSSIRRLVSPSTAAGPPPVPNNPKALLMHYVGCVCDAIDVHPEAASFIARMSDYAHADELGRDDQFALVRSYFEVSFRFD